MKILTNKEEPLIHGNEFEVWDNNKRLTCGGRFQHINCKTRKESINIVFDNNMDKDTLLKIVELIHDTFIGELDE